MSPLSRALAIEIYERRVGKSLTQKDVYSRARLAKNTYLRLEHGERRATLDQVLAIAAALEVPPGEFVTAIVERAKAEALPTRSRVGEEWDRILGYDG